MPARTGREFLEGLRDGREVWVGAEKVADIAGHPSLSGAARTVAAIYDLQHEAADACLMPDPETGEPVAVSHLIPRSRADLARRHQAIETVAEYSVGLMARTPDYVNVTLAGFAGREDEWARYGNERGAENLIRYQKTIAHGDLCLTPTIVHATVDRARGNLPSGLDPVGLHKVEDTSSGISRMTRMSHPGSASRIESGLGASSVDEGLRCGITRIEPVEMVHDSSSSAAKNDFHGRSIAILRSSGSGAGRGEGIGAGF